MISVDKMITRTDPVIDKKRNGKKYGIMRNLIVIFIFSFLVCNTISSQEIVKSESNYCFMEMNGNSCNVQSCSYTIHNNDTTRMVLLFIEDDNTSRPHFELLKRKMIHRYGDFSLSMFEWEANMDIEHGCMVILNYS